MKNLNDVMSFLGQLEVVVDNVDPVEQPQNLNTIPNVSRDYTQQVLDVIAGRIPNPEPTSTLEVCSNIQNLVYKMITVILDSPHREEILTQLRVRGNVQTNEVVELHRNITNYALEL